MQFFFKIALALVCVYVCAVPHTIVPCRCQCPYVPMCVRPCLCPRPCPCLWFCTTTMATGTDTGTGTSTLTGMGARIHKGTGEGAGAGTDMDGGAGTDMDGGAGTDMDGGAGIDMGGGAGTDMDGGAGTDMDGGAGTLAAGTRTPTRASAAGSRPSRPFGAPNRGECVAEGRHRRCTGTPPCNCTPPRAGASTCSWGPCSSRRSGPRPSRATPCAFEGTTWPGSAPSQRRPPPRRPGLHLRISDRTAVLANECDTQPSS